MTSIKLKIKPARITFLISVIILLNNNIFPQLSSLNTKLLQIKNTYDVAGMSVCVVKANKIVFSKGYGLRDISRNLPVNENTIYRIASISKLITAAALMKLYEQGLFNLDDDVSLYLGYNLRNPNFPNDVITFRKILSHTSSLRDGSGYDNFLSASYNNNPPPALKSLLTTNGSYFTSDMFSSSKSPSSNYFTYSNINYGVAGTLVEQISNKRFDIFCKENILAPLGMNASFNIQDLININNVAVLYRKSNGVWYPQAENYGGVMPPPRDLSNYIIGSNALIFAPQGGLRVSANDLSIFMRMMMNGGILNDVRILNDSTVNKMFNPNWIFNGSNGDNYYGIFNTYGFGSHRTNDLLPNETLYGHPGEAYGLISDVYFSKNNNYGIIFITNGGQWGFGNYSGWYNIEEDIYQTCFNNLDSLTVNVDEQTQQQPKGFYLYQNYPNPFNPTTTIMYSVSAANPNFASTSRVQLKVYDLLCNEVATLVDEYKTAGSYKVDFNAVEKMRKTSLPSGIYFYKLQAGNFVETKKMILLK
jgi:CubicO group peptidase (beta-lactamase class C family)